MSVSYTVVGRRDGQPVTYVVRDERGAFYTYDLASGLVLLVDQFDYLWPFAGPIPKNPRSPRL